MNKRILAGAIFYTFSIAAVVGLIWIVTLGFINNQWAVTFSEFACAVVILSGFFLYMWAAEEVMTDCKNIDTSKTNVDGEDK